MKTIKQIAKDCGLTDDQFDLMDRILEDHPSLAGTIEPDAAEIVGALYRRIELLDPLLKDLFDDWITLVGGDLAENNEDCKQILKRYEEATK